LEKKNNTGQIWADLSKICFITEAYIFEISGSSHEFVFAISYTAFIKAVI